MAMDLDHGHINLPTNQAQTQATILCYNCGAPIDGTLSAGALCYDCLKLTVDVSEGIQREATLHTCRDCERWLQPPNQWLPAQLESRELLSICLRKLRGLNKVRVIDASFIWTEPHSRRIRVKITVQQEAAEATILQQTFEVEYVIANQQCPDCAKSYTANTWRAAVQVRQKVPHKRTFLYLEQLILKHGAHKDTINIREVKDGLDFFFSARNSAEKFVDFLTSVTPVRVKKSQELISMDIHTSTKSYKFTFSCELVPVCKDDLVALPIKLARSIGNINPLSLCYKIGTAVYLLDPNTLQTAEVSTGVYWRAPFKKLADVQALAEFVVLDIEPLGPTKGRLALAEVEVARASDLGSNDTTFRVRTHLGGILHAGDSVMGYDLAGTNFNDDNFEALANSTQYSKILPDVVLVRKHYQRKKNSSSKRNWKLKRMAKDEGELLPKKSDQQRLEEDYERFLRDVEEDEDLRNTLALYKAQKEEQRRNRKVEKMEGVEEEDEGEGGGMDIESTVDGDDDDESEDGGVPKIDTDQLLEDLEELRIEE